MAGLRRIQESIIWHRDQFCTFGEELTEGEGQGLQTLEDRVREMAVTLKGLIAKAPQEYHDEMEEGFEPHWDFTSDSPCTLRSACDAVAITEKLLSGPFGQNVEPDKLGKKLQIQLAKVRLKRHDLQAQLSRGEISNKDFESEQSKLSHEEAELLEEKRRRNETVELSSHWLDVCGAGNIEANGRYERCEDHRGLPQWSKEGTPWRISSEGPVGPWGLATILATTTITVVSAMMKK
eukprot:TRINITY_DN26384_c0_g1_i1.p1 TRINITY_DN26384_c0_g1~~TRINITY_DN26384_c0_g1_i1.p1  ORF type:complete len:251 (-),score=31.03 TRINITY_DN26384_c0_g1_i1:60-767(-)